MKTFALTQDREGRVYECHCFQCDRETAIRSMCESLDIAERSYSLEHAPDGRMSWLKVYDALTESLIVYMDVSPFQPFRHNLS